jgi:hypothetical protein
MLLLFPSGFRLLHSTETAVLKSDIVETLDRGDVVVLLLLDLSVAMRQYYGDWSRCEAHLATLFAGCHPIFLDVTTSCGSERNALR